MCLLFVDSCSSSWCRDGGGGGVRGIDLSEHVALHVGLVKRADELVVGLWWEKRGRNEMGEKEQKDEMMFLF